ncbi:hypothetical protein Goklo_005716 [Gossypium klotzschianum]|uniref:RNase H type-1 domain-containing protein n=2 Tax=Gossypium TaxID=3633 RepID=A0A7J8VF54_9ROSI|nr:hypothetical protein [Gossypium klotzschianum]
MTTARLLVTVCKEIEKTARNFIWGSTSLERKPALVNWKEVCLPFDKGGLGIRGLQDQNKIFLLKMGYNILANTEALWDRLLRNKYNVHGFLPDSIERNNLNFWNDNWVEDVRPLKFLHIGRDHIDETLIVCNVVTGNGSWNWRWLESQLPQTVLARSLRSCLHHTIVWEHSSRIWENDAPQITNETGMNLLKFYSSTIDGEWPTLFSIVSWLIWKHGNDFIFKGASYSNMDLIATSIAWARSISNLARLNNSCCSEYTKEYWQPQPVGWVKGNIDGSIPKHTSSAAVGGMIRDHEGNWLFGFGMRIGRYGIFQTEARALYEGLVVAWHEGFRQIEVESDNAILIDVVSNRYVVGSNLSEVRLVHTMILKE